jgi:DNA repair exonuclease SbcCD ATPase subunit
MSENKKKNINEMYKKKILYLTHLNQIYEVKVTKYKEQHSKMKGLLEKYRVREGQYSKQANEIAAHYEEKLKQALHVAKQLEIDKNKKISNLEENKTKLKELLKQQELQREQLLNQISDYQKQAQIKNVQEKEHEQSEELKQEETDKGKMLQQLLEKKEQKIQQLQVEVTANQERIERLKQENQMLQDKGNEQTDQIQRMKENIRELEQELVATKQIYQQKETVEMEKKKLVDEIQEKERQLVQEKESMSLQIQLLTSAFQKQLEQLKQNQEINQKGNVSHHKLLNQVERENSSGTDQIKIISSTDDQNQSNKSASNKKGTFTDQQLPPELQANADQNAKFLRNHQVPYESNYVQSSKKKMND